MGPSDVFPNSEAGPFSLCWLRVTPGYPGARMHALSVSDGRGRSVGRSRCVLRAVILHPGDPTRPCLEVRSQVGFLPFPALPPSPSPSPFLPCLASFSQVEPYWDFVSKRGNFAAVPRRTRASERSKSAKRRKQGRQKGAKQQHDEWAPRKEGSQTSRSSPVAAKLAFTQTRAYGPSTCRFFGKNEQEHPHAVHIS